MVSLSLPRSRGYYRKVKDRSFHYATRLSRRSIARLVILLIVVVAAIVGIVGHVRNLNKGKPYKFTELEAKELKIEDTLTRGFQKKHPISMRNLDSAKDSVFQIGCREPDNSQPRANAAFVMLTRNEELDGVIHSMKSMERHFNQWFNYPWVFLNDAEFTPKFKKTVKQYTKAKVSFGRIPKTAWEFGDTDEKAVIDESIENQGDRGIMYGNMPSYHKMCRFYSNYFFKHPLVKKLDWYWRVEPDVDFYCDLTYDPFLELEKSGKKYGFTMVIKELIATVPSLFRKTLEFVKNEEIAVPDSFGLFAYNFKFYEGLNEEHYKGVTTKKDFFERLEQRVPMMSLLKRLESKGNGLSEEDIDEASINSLVDHSNKRGLPKLGKDTFNDQEYTLCHFWSNFEIARTDLFTSPEYQRYFDFLEQSGGFYKERWGDAPVHSLAVGLFLSFEQIHYFRDIGYQHTTLAHCPANAPDKQLPYTPAKDFKLLNAREEKFWAKTDAPRENGVGCRCRCPAKQEEIEDATGSCFNLWVGLTHDLKEPERKLNLNSIEQRALMSYEMYLQAHKGDGSGWKLKPDEIKNLEKDVL